MQPRTASTQPAPRQPRSTLVRTKLDWAIIISLLAMGLFNLIAMADQVGVTKAYAAVPACGAPLA